VKYVVQLIETTVHEVEVECSVFDDPEQVACRLWEEGLLVDPSPMLLHLRPTLISNGVGWRRGNSGADSNSL
jgi:hypothetical protein